MRRYIIIGASAAGVSCAQRLRSLCPQDEIILFSAEYDDPYNKCLLIDYAKGNITHEQLTIFNMVRAQQQKIDFKKSSTITTIHPDNQTVIDHRGNEYIYDILVLATGSIPQKPLYAARNLFSFHTLSDVHAIQECLVRSTATRAVIIGAGITGLECADFLWSQRLSVTLLEQTFHPLSGYIEPSAASYVALLLSRSGIGFCGSAYIDTFITHNGSIRGIVLSTGQELCADLFIQATGTMPHGQLAICAGVAVDTNGSVMVDSYFKTNKPHIYAIGDLIGVPLKNGTHTTVKSHLWPDSVMQGAQLAAIIAGKGGPYKGIEQRLSTAVLGYNIYSYGPMAGHSERVEIVKDDQNHYYQAFLRSQKGVLQGFTLISTEISEQVRLYKNMMK